MKVAEAPSSSSDLLEAARNRDPQAWRRLTEIYGPLVFEWGQRSGLQAADAADVLQQVFVTVFNSFAAAHWDRPSDSFRGWLRTIFHSRLMDFYRQNRRQPVVVDDSQLLRNLPEVLEQLTSVATNNEADMLVQTVLRVIKQDFSETTWQAFWRSVVDGEATSNVARELKLTPAAVCMSRARVLRRIREMLSGSGIFPDEPSR